VQNVSRLQMLVGLIVAGSTPGTEMQAQGRVLSAVCMRSEQCTSNVCAGRCCNVNQPCECPQPNPQNRLKNTGFDTHVANWGSDGTLTWSSNDSDSCPFSGSLNAAGYPVNE
jgi:hypothetical protein